MFLSVIDSRGCLPVLYRLKIWPFGILNSRYGLTVLYTLHVVLSIVDSRYSLSVS